MFIHSSRLSQISTKSWSIVRINHFKNKILFSFSKKDFIVHACLVATLVSLASLKLALTCIMKFTVEIYLL